MLLGARHWVDLRIRPPTQHNTPREWPWAGHRWRPSEDPERDLVKAAALIAAEIDRLARKRERSPAPEAPAKETSVCPSAVLDKACEADATVNTMLHSGYPLECVVSALAQEKARLLNRLMELEMIAPRRMTVDGMELIFRAPDSAVPSISPPTT